MAEDKIPGLVDPWVRWRTATTARIGLSQTGNAPKLQHVLDFQLAHAKARDAVHEAVDWDSVTRTLGSTGIVRVESQAGDRATYLRRPDLGRRLAPSSSARLERGDWDLAFIIADGLSAAAVRNHAAAVLNASMVRLENLRIPPIVVASQARVAIGDEIGERLGAKLVAVLIGERPGLSVADSLGIYLTFAPRSGRRDSERNCISNIHNSGGMTYDHAAEKLAHLAHAALRLGYTGTALKDDNAVPRLI